MSKASILLAGAGGHARACIDVIELEDRYEIAGLLGLAPEVGGRVLGYPVLGTDADAPSFSQRHANALVTIGQIRTPDLRMRMFDILEMAGYAFPVIVSPRAHVSRHAQLGVGTIVLHGAVVNAGAVVGRNCIINSQALVEHDAVVGDHCHVSTNAALNSRVRVGAGTFVGSTSSVRQGTVIGERCLIGMGQQVLKDCPAGTALPPLKGPR